MQTSASRVRYSYKRCTDNYGFLQEFYQRFITSSPLVAERFANTDIDHQVLMLRASLELLVARGAVLEENQGLQRIAQLHSRNDRDIPPELYDLWLNCLIETVRCYDPYCDEQLEREWRQLLEPGIEAIRARY